MLQAYPLNRAAVLGFSALSTTAHREMKKRGYPPFWICKSGPKSCCAWIMKALHADWQTGFVCNACWKCTVGSGGGVGVGSSSMLLHFNAATTVPPPLESSFIHHNADSARQLYLTPYLKLPGTPVCQPQNAKPGDASQS